MNNTSQTVAQSEIEQLLASVGNTDAAAIEIPSPARHKGTDTELIQRFEFPVISFFSGGELRKLRVRHEIFISALARRLAIYLGIDISLQMSRLECVTYKKFTESLSNPTHLSLVRLEPLKGTCLLDFPPHLALCMVDRELGGPALSVDEPRDLSRLESLLLSRILEMILGEWCNNWKDLYDLRPALLKHESSARFIKTCAPETTMLVLGMSAEFAGVSDQIQFAFPHFTLEPLLLKLNAADEREEKPQTSSAGEMSGWNTAYDDLELPVTAELPAMEITAREFIALKPGDVIPIKPQLARQVRVCVASAPKFTGILGSNLGKLAVKISEVHDA